MGPADRDGQIRRVTTRRKGDALLVPLQSHGRNHSLLSLHTSNRLPVCFAFLAKSLTSDLCKRLAMDVDAFNFLSVAQTPSKDTVTFDDLPAEVLSYIVRLIYLESIPRSHHRNLDLHGLPSTYSDGRRISSPHSTVQSTLWALCLTSKRLFAHARPLLYRRINVTLPFSFMLLIRTLGAAALARAYERFQVTGKLNQDPNDPESFTSIVAAAGFARVLGTNLRISDSAPNSTIRSRSQQRRVASTSVVDDGEADEDELDLVWRPGERRSVMLAVAIANLPRTSQTLSQIQTPPPHTGQSLCIPWEATPTPSNAASGSSTSPNSARKACADLLAMGSNEDSSQLHGY